MSPTGPLGQPTEKIDRRGKRTRQALRNALLELIQEKGYAAITVEDITQRANLGRATFYLHFRDKEDLLLEQLSELALDRMSLLAKIPLTGWDMEENPPYSPLVEVFENAAQNAELYRSILRGEGALWVTERLREIIREVLNELVQSNEGKTQPHLSIAEPLDFVASYLAGALIGSIAWWLEQPPPLDAVEMTRKFQIMFFPGAMRVFGLSMDR